MAARAVQAFLRRKPPAERGNGAFNREVNVVIAGHAGAGKTTLFRHMQFADGTLQGDADRRRQFRAVVQSTAVADLLHLARHVRALGWSLDPGNEERCAALQGTAEKMTADNQVFFPLKLAYDMKCLWDDEAVQAAFQDRSNPMRLNNTTKFLLDRLFLLFEPLYVPTKLDILSTHDACQRPESTAFVHNECRITVHSMTNEMWTERRQPETNGKPYVLLVALSLDEYDRDPRITVAPAAQPGQRRGGGVMPVQLLSSPKLTPFAPSALPAAASDEYKSDSAAATAATAVAPTTRANSGPPSDVEASCGTSAAAEIRRPELSGTSAPEEGEKGEKKEKRRRKKRLAEVPKDLRTSDPLVSDLLKEALADPNGTRSSSNGSRSGAGGAGGGGGSRAGGEEKKKKKHHRHHTSKAVSGGGSPNTPDKPPEFAAVPELTLAPSVPFPYQNGLTATLDQFAELQRTPLFAQAAGVCVLLTKADLFLRKARETSIKCSFPDFQGPDADPAAALDHVKRLLLSRVPEEMRVRYEVLPVNAVDEKEMAEAVMPRLLSVAVRLSQDLCAHPVPASSASEDLRPSSSSVKEEKKEKKEKAHVESKKLKLRSGYVSEQGRRPHMEDTHVALDEVPREGLAHHKEHRPAFYAVYDGHGGIGSAEVAARVLHNYLFDDPVLATGDVASACSAAFKRTDGETIRLNDKTGATAVTALVLNKTLWVANIGDSECVLGSRDGKSHVATLMTKKHIPDDPDERARLLAAGAMILYKRLYGTLAVSRAFGDAEFKEKPFVLSDPHLMSRPLTRNDQVLVIACDGLWDKVTYQEAADIAMDMKDKGQAPGEVARTLCALTLDRNSLDNVTILVVFFNWG